MAPSPADLHARHLKELTSQVKKLRGWVASDPGKAAPLVDALNELTALRLLAHRYVDAAADAQDALTRANKLVAEHGAVGPFTPVDDGVRFVTATTHLACAQTGAGQAAPGAQLAQAALGWMALLPHVDLVPRLAPRTTAWLLMAQASGAAASGDLGAANAYADAALARATEGGLSSGDDAAVLVDAARLAADLRWSAGIVGDAVRWDRTASAAAAQVAAPVLHGETRVTHAWTQRVLPPWVASHRDLADRLFAAGDAEGALAERRHLAGRLAAHAGRLGDVARAGLTTTLADLAWDLLAVDRLDEALDAAGRAADTAGALAAGEAVAGEHLEAQFAAVTALARALLAQGDPSEAAEALGSLHERYSSLRKPAGLEAALAVATLVRADVARALGDQSASERSLREFHALVADLRAAHPASALYADVPNLTFARDRARGVATRSPLPSPSWSPLPDAAALAASTRSPLPLPEPEPVVVAEPIPPSAPVPAEAVHAAPEPLAEPEPFVVPEAEMVPDAEVVPEPHVEPDAAEVVPEPHVEPDAVRTSAPVTPTPVAAPEPVGAPEPVAASASDGLEAVQAASAADGLEAVRAAFASAKASGNRQQVLAAATALVAALRPVADADPGQHGAALVGALDELGDAKFRAGDWWGSRAPKKEAKQLARTLGL